MHQSGPVGHSSFDLFNRRSNTLVIGRYILVYFSTRRVALISGRKVGVHNKYYCIAKYLANDILVIHSVHRQYLLKWIKRKSKQSKQFKFAPVNMPGIRRRAAQATYSSVQWPPQDTLSSRDAANKRNCQFPIDFPPAYSRCSRTRNYVGHSMQ